MTKLALTIVLAVAAAFRLSLALVFRPFLERLAPVIPELVRQGATVHIWPTGIVILPPPPPPLDPPLSSPK